jgi:elongation factor P
MTFVSGGVGGGAASNAASGVTPASAVCPRFWHMCVCRLHSNVPPPQSALDEHIFPAHSGESSAHGSEPPQAARAVTRRPARPRATARMGRILSPALPVAVIKLTHLRGREPRVDTLPSVGYELRRMYDTSDIRKGLKVLIDGNPYTIVEFQFVKPGKGAAFTRTKFKNLVSGAVIERNIRSGEKLEPANVEERKMQFLFREGEDFVFMDSASYEQTHVGTDIIGDDWKFLKDNLECSVLFFNDRPVGASLPNFVTLRILKTEPGVRGDTSGNVTKPATVETNAEVQVPLFVKEGEYIRIDTRTGEYIERVAGP